MYVRKNVSLVYFCAKCLIFFWIVSDIRVRNEEPATFASSAVVSNELLYDRLIKQGTPHLSVSESFVTLIPFIMPHRSLDANIYYINLISILFKNC